MAFKRADGVYLKVSVPVEHQPGCSRLDGGACDCSPTIGRMVPVDRTPRLRKGWRTSPAPAR